MTNTKYSVWVGGTEVSDYCHDSLTTAIQQADSWRLPSPEDGDDEGYGDQVAINVMKYKRKSYWLVWSESLGWIKESLRDC